MLRLSPRKRLVILASVAVLLPLALLSFMQYRSLVELENKTKVAFKENLRQTLLDIERQVAGKFEAIASRSLIPVGNIKLSSKESTEQFEKYFSGVKQSQPEIDRIFVFSHCGCEEENNSFGYVYSDSLFKLEHSDLNGDVQAHKILHAFNESRATQNFLGAGRQFLFRQQICSECLANGQAIQETYVFFPLLAAHSQKQIGFAGVTINENYISNDLLSRAIAEVLDSRDTGIPNSADVVIAISGENGREIYTIHPVAAITLLKPIWLALLPTGKQ
jgi:hypothetical protein